MKSEGQFRIGELSRRSGVSPELLRAWERRYGLLDPERSSGGLRLYSGEDLERVRAMRSHLAGGVAAAEAAILAKRSPVAAEPGEPGAAAYRAEMLESVDAFDEARLQRVLDSAIAAMTVDALLDAVILPLLRDLGQLWQDGQMSVAQEHFATGVIRGRLVSLARDWGRGLGPLAVLACLPLERHDFGLLGFGLALHARGWRIVYLGSDTPLESLEEVCETAVPDLVAVSSVTRRRARAATVVVRRLARRHKVVVGGAGFEAAAGKTFGTATVGGAAVATAEQLTEELRA